jgi:polyisoprenyl-teichoic acid--peptidoglycan teichoic acid transferase
VEIPGYGRNRVNTAFVYGALGGNLAEGAAMAITTLENTLHVPIDHYVLVDFSAFIRLIDALGGIDVYVPYTIDDPLYPDMEYGYDPLYIPAGPHQFDGETALKYARTRRQDNDFYRAQRQQQVIMAVRQKVFNLGLTNLISRAPALYRQVSQGVFTDLTLDEIIRLAKVATAIETENIQRAVLDYEYVSSHLTENGAQVLLMDEGKTAVLIQQLFHDR